MRAASSFGFVRVAVVSPELQVADVSHNTRAILAALTSIADQRVQLAVLPELALTGYTCADLLYQPLLLRAAWNALLDVAAASARLNMGVAVGLPLVVDGRLYNTAAIVCGGRILGIVPKSYLPTTNEYYERRWFSSGRDVRGCVVRDGEVTAPFGTDLLFRAVNVPECVIGVEICEDLWAVQPPSGHQALAGATIVLNPSASVELLGRATYRRELVKQQSARCMAAYLYDLHDFFLHNVVRHQFPPRKILFLAEQAFDGQFTPAELVRWMTVFYRRFFNQQFKRSALPDGPKVGSVALSPRGDWRMPSDAVAVLWMREVESLAD